MAGPPIISTDDRARSWLLLAGGILATIAVVFGLVQLWPDGDDDAATTETTEQATTTILGGNGGGTTVPGAIGEPSDRPTDGGDDGAGLFEGGLVDAVDDLVARAGDPEQVIELSVYPEYAFLAYRDPENPGNLDRREWRDGDVSDAQPNIIDDRVDADTEPSLFSLSEVDLSRIPELVDDAATRYSIPVDVTHIIIDRFLPFDDRVLIRIYATPSDGRSGGGYVTYDTAGTYVETCC